MTRRVGSQKTDPSGRRKPTRRVGFLCDGRARRNSRLRAISVFKYFSRLGNVENRVRLVSDRYAAHLHVTPTTTATADDVFALRAKAADAKEVDHGQLPQ